MNIISNNCVGARIYQQLEIQFNNPFMWSLVKPGEFIYLINHYGEINFKNRKIIRHDNTYSIVIDKKIELLFIHHIQDPKYDIPTRSATSIDMYYNKMDQYLLERYDRRVDRMNENPSFVISDKKGVEGYTFTDPGLLSNVKKNYSIIYAGEKDPGLEHVQYVYTLNDSTENIAKKILKASERNEISNLYNS